MKDDELNLWELWADDDMNDNFDDDAELANLMSEWLLMEAIHQDP